MKLAESLSDWTDYDIAMFEFGRALGIFPEGTTFGSVRGMFFMETPLSSALGEAMDALVKIGVLAYREAEYRWVGTVDIPAVRRATSGDQ
ncbi:hypothetical protein DN069_18555 [Streptacidiphilus pinicola]|uniref:Uncharacterized protein n=1 Tax=Streptacidiphilus pinicola TaxID=2219663 RepID=A0A2X0IHW3_9ACTN|nr:hypothetical protein [Streptacidiphilus pinicola]RAG84157.1 hypothetical protein DN069_18555 [Streptacidiphilus pinicola]